MSPVFLATVVAALLPHEVVVVAVAEPPAVVTRIELPGAGLALFATPDGRLVVPLAGEDSTVVVDPDGGVRRQPGRLFPLFFDEPDRFLTLVPGALVMMSYPDRLPLSRTPLPGFSGAWRAACTASGGLVAVIPGASPRRELLLVAGRGGGAPIKVALPADALALALDPRGAWVLVGTSAGSVQAIAPGSPQQERWAADGEVRALAVTPDGRGALAGVRRAEGARLVGLRVAASPPALKVRFELPLPAPPAALLAAGSHVLAATEHGIILLDHGGRRYAGELPLAGASELVILPERPRSALPSWSDAGQ